MIISHNVIKHKSSSYRDQWAYQRSPFYFVILYICYVSKHYNWPDMCLYTIICCKVHLKLLICDLEI